MSVKVNHSKSFERQYSSDKILSNLESDDIDNINKKHNIRKGRVSRTKNSGDFRNSSGIEPINSSGTGPRHLTDSKVTENQFKHNQINQQTENIISDMQIKSPIDDTPVKINGENIDRSKYTLNSIHRVSNPRPKHRSENIGQKAIQSLPRSDFRSKFKNRSLSNRIKYGNDGVVSLAPLNIELDKAKTKNTNKSLPTSDTIKPENTLNISFPRNNIIPSNKYGSSNKSIVRIPSNLNISNDINPKPKNQDKQSPIISLNSPIDIKHDLNDHDVVPSFYIKPNNGNVPKVDENTKIRSNMIDNRRNIITPNNQDDLKYLNDNNTNNNIVNLNSSVKGSPNVVSPSNNIFIPTVLNTPPFFSESNSNISKNNVPLVPILQDDINSSKTRSNIIIQSPKIPKTVMRQTIDMPGNTNIQERITYDKLSNRQSNIKSNKNEHNHFPTNLSIGYQDLDISEHGLSHISNVDDHVGEFKEKLTGHLDEPIILNRFPPRNNGKRSIDNRYQSNGRQIDNTYKGYIDNDNNKYKNINRYNDNQNINNQRINDQHENNQYIYNKYGDNRLGNYRSMNHNIYRNEYNTNNIYKNDDAHRNEQYSNNSNNQYMIEQYRNNRYKNDDARRDEHSNNQYRIEQYRNNRYKNDDAHRNEHSNNNNNQYRIEQYRNNRYKNDDAHRDEQYSNNGNNQYRREQYRNDKYMNDKYRYHQRGDDRYVYGGNIDNETNKSMILSGRNNSNVNGIYVKNYDILPPELSIYNQNERKPIFITMEDFDHIQNSEHIDLSENKQPIYIPLTSPAAFYGKRALNNLIREPTKHIEVDRYENFDQEYIENEQEYNKSLRYNYRQYVLSKDINDSDKYIETNIGSSNISSNRSNIKYNDQNNNIIFLNSNVVDSSTERKNHSNAEYQSKPDKKYQSKRDKEYQSNNNVKERYESNVKERSKSNVKERSKSNAKDKSKSNVKERSKSNVKERSKSNAKDKSNDNMIDKSDDDEELSGNDGEQNKKNKLVVKPVNSGNMPDYDNMDNVEQARFRAHFLVMFGRMRTLHPQYNIPDVSAKSLPEIHGYYEAYYYHFTIRSTVQYYMLILTAGWLGIEILFTKAFGLDSGGFALNQLNLADTYERYMYEFAEKYTGVGAGYSPETKIIGLTILSTVVYVALKSFSSWIGGPAIAGTVQNYFNKFLNGEMTMAASGNLSQNFAQSSAQNSNQTSNQTSNQNSQSNPTVSDIPNIPDATGFNLGGFNITSMLPTLLQTVSGFTSNNNNNNNNNNQNSNNRSSGRRNRNHRRRPNFTC